MQVSDRLNEIHEERGQEIITKFSKRVSEECNKDATTVKARLNKH